MCIRDSTLPIPNLIFGDNRLEVEVTDSQNLTSKSAPVVLSVTQGEDCLLYTSDAADERSSVDLGGRRIIKKKKRQVNVVVNADQENNETE